MKKTFKLTDLECANCAAKMEDKIRKIDGVADVRVSFLTQKMTLDVDETRFDSIIKQIIKICRKIEPDCVINL